MIHGNAVSIGCLAMGDSAAEELFVLAARTGLRNINVILSPVDFRDGKIAKPLGNTPQWLDGLYEIIKTELSQYEKKKAAKPINPVILSIRTAKNERSTNLSE